MKDAGVKLEAPAWWIRLLCWFGLAVVPWVLFCHEDKRILLWFPIGIVSLFLGKLYTWRYWLLAFSYGIYVLHFFITMLCRKKKHYEIMMFLLVIIVFQNWSGWVLFLKSQPDAGALILPRHAAVVFRLHLA